MNTTCTCPSPAPSPASSSLAPSGDDTCRNDIGLAVGIGVLVACVILLVSWLIFYYCCVRNAAKFSRLHSAVWGSSKAGRAHSQSHKCFAGNYFVDTNDSYLLETGQAVDFNYFNEGAEDKNEPLPREGDQAQTPEVHAGHRPLMQQPSQTSAALLEDTSAASSNFSPNLGDRANFPIIGCNDNLPPLLDSTLSLRSNSTMAAMDLSFWPSLPGESNVDLRPPVLTARVTSTPATFSSEQMQVTLLVNESDSQPTGSITVGTSSQPEDQPELDQASSLVTAVYTVSPSAGSAGSCHIRVPLSCHLMDVDNNDDTGYDTLPEVDNLVVMMSKLSGDGSNAEWNDFGSVTDFTECSEEDRTAVDCPSGYVEFDVEGSALFTVRCDSGIWVKSMCLSHFAAALDEDQTWALRIFLHRDKTVDYEKVCQYAQEFNMTPVGMPQPFHLPQHSYVHVLISSITEGCALDGSSHGVLHGEGCWPNLEQPPFVEFRLRQVHGCLPLPLVRVRTDVVVADDFDNITFELLSQWSTKAQMKMDKKMPESLLSRTKSAGAWPWILVSPWQQLTNAQVNQMLSILDRPLMGDQDYSTLAALLGYTEEQVKFFSLQRPSPTEALLKDLHTRLPVTRVTDRLLVALGRMGAVWLSDFLRQACRVDRAQIAATFEESVSNAANDTLPRRAASGIYSSIRRTLNGTLKLTEEEKGDSQGQYQRRVQRMSGRKLGSNKRSSAAVATSSASVAIYASATMPRQPPQSAPPVPAGGLSPSMSWSKPLLPAGNDSGEDSTSLARSNMRLADGGEGLGAAGPSAGRHHGDLHLTSSSGSHKMRQRVQSTSAIYGSTKGMAEKNGRLGQVFGPAGQSGGIYTLHQDPSTPHRAILQPAPFITNNRVGASFHRSTEQHTDTDNMHRNESLVHRVAKKLNRTSSMPSSERATKRKAGQRRPVSNEVVHPALPCVARDTGRNTASGQLSEPLPAIPRRLHPYEEHVVPLPPRKESLRH